MISQTDLRILSLMVEKTNRLVEILKTYDETEIHSNYTGVYTPAWGISPRRGSGFAHHVRKRTPLLIDYVELMFQNRLRLVS